MKYKLSSILSEYKETNDKSLYEPVAVGKYGIRKRSEIYKKKLSDDYAKNKVIRENCLIVGMGSNQIDVGVLLRDEIYSVSPAYHTYRINTELINSDYIELLFNAKNANYFNKYSIATARQGKKIDLKALLGEEVDVPSFDIQKKTVELIAHIKYLINTEEASLLLLDELIKSRFNEMFANCINYEKLGNLSILITKGASPKWQGINYIKSGVLFVTSENVRNGFMDLSNPKYLEEKVNIKQPRSVLQRGDILINIVGASIGRAAIYNLDLLANINQAVCLVRISKLINPIYLINYLNSNDAMIQYKNMIKSMARDNLSLQNIADIQIPLPEKEKQDEFDAFVDRIDKLKFNTQQRIEKYQELLNKIMDEYFN
ncbi:MAG: restriction endonuclease subunit S [Clostridia bacterium]|nr:restriction endonuclease subunit S [Clostridia bacterium]